MLDSWEIIWNNLFSPQSASGCGEDELDSLLNCYDSVDSFRLETQTFLDSVFLTDACMIYAPSQIALAAVIHAASRQKQNLNLCLDATFKAINLNLWKQIVISFSLLFRLWKDLSPMRHPASEWLPAQPPDHVAHLHHQEVGGGQGVGPNTIVCISRQSLILLLRSWGGGLQKLNTY